MNSKKRKKKTLRNSRFKITGVHDKVQGTNILLDKNLPSSFATLKKTKYIDKTIKNSYKNGEIINMQKEVKPFYADLLQ